jgi:hypothetical protein
MTADCMTGDRTTSLCRFGARISLEFSTSPPRTGDARGTLAGTTMIRFGKSNADYMVMRRSLVDDARDPARVERVRRVSRLYAAQPPRMACVVCEGPLGAAVLEVFGVGYTLCAACGHFNGLFEDTPAFGRALYEEDANHQGDAYIDPDPTEYAKRVASVYRPKADFLCDALRAEGAEPSTMTVADIGAGAGHFVAALRECGFAASIGYDPSPSLSEAGNRLLGQRVIEPMDVANAGHLARTVEADVITMIFSLEHVAGLGEFMTALRENRRAKYLFFAVPTYSPSVFLEAIFQETMPRILGNGHTHLFSDGSIDALCKRFRMRRAAEWWFGGNGFDLYRQIAVALAAAGQPREAQEAWHRAMAPMVDDLQLAMDRHRMASEVHVVAALE